MFEFLGRFWGKVPSTYEEKEQRTNKSVAFNLLAGFALFAGGAEAVDHYFLNDHDWLWMDAAAAVTGLLAGFVRAMVVSDSLYSAYRKEQEQ
jgi:hypothetical protein